jgi:hypothetical protein
MRVYCNGAHIYAQANQERENIERCASHSFLTFVWILNRSVHVCHLFLTFMKVRKPRPFAKRNQSLQVRDQHQGRRGVQTF